MEKKDWRTKIGSILNNNRVDILDKDGSELLNDLEELFNQELDKAREEVIKDLIKKIEEAHCDSISLELLKEIDLSKLKQ